MGYGTIDVQKNNFAALSVGDILQYNLLPAALRNEFSVCLYGMQYALKYQLRKIVYFRCKLFPMCSQLLIDRGATPWTVNFLKKLVQRCFSAAKGRLHDRQFGILRRQKSL